ncbi:MAG: (4Fe-4S)-binding protein [Flavobacteriales bacterium]|nr:(4Fe-4S)-binding protein [Flavobacteriales bacterium]
MDKANLRKEYTNGEVTVVWQSGKCIHSANCVKNNPKVFRPREQPWIQTENGTTEDIIETVKKCPSGALTYFLNSEQTGSADH